MSDISVIVPNYNKEKYIKPCLNSLVNQEEVEILFIDDNSTDNSLHVAKQYEHNFPKKVKVISLEKNIGLSAVRNLGLQEAQKDVIGFVDSDDMVALNMYKDYLKLLKEYQAPMVVGSLFRMSETETEPFLASEKGKPKLISMVEEQPYVSISCCTNIYKRCFLENVKFLENCYYEDVSFIYPLLLKAKQFIRYPRADYGYRHTPNSIMKRKYQLTDNSLDIIEIIKDALKKAEQFHLNEKEKEILKKLLRKVYCHNVSWLECSSLLEKEKRFFIETLLSIGNYYLPGIKNNCEIFINREYKDFSLKETEEMTKRLKRKIKKITTD